MTNDEIKELISEVDNGLDRVLESLGAAQRKLVEMQKRIESMLVDPVPTNEEDAVRTIEAVTIRNGVLSFRLLNSMQEHLVGQYRVVRPEGFPDEAKRATAYVFRLGQPDAVVWLRSAECEACEGTGESPTARMAKASGLEAGGMCMVCRGSGQKTLATEAARARRGVDDASAAPAEPQLEPPEPGGELGGNP
jgi:hypothetical protein